MKDVSKLGFMEKSHEENDSEPRSTFLNNFVIIFIEFLLNDYLILIKNY